MRKISHSWRKLPIKERLKIPTDKFGLDEDTINKIRNIKDKKKRLIESARIQYELFNNIHTDLTSWIAGYASDSSVRNIIGSSRELREIFIKPTISNKKIKPSWMDIKRRIKIPEKINERLAEEIGIHIGDGSLYLGINKNGTNSYRYSVSGDLKNEYPYHDYIKYLMKTLYNIDCHVTIRENKNSIESIYKSKSLLEFKNKILGLPLGSKKDIQIPNELLKVKEFQKRCIVGIIDTDFSITSSMAITGKLNNLFIVKQMSNILNENKIQHICKVYKNYGRFYINQKGATRIIEEWGLKNKKHTSKYLIWRKYNKFLPFTTTTERLAVLDGKLDIENIIKISNKRKKASAGLRTLPVR